MDVIVINHNTREHLRACLASLTAEADTVVVVDNNSTDGSVGMVLTEFPWVTLRASPTNAGYGAAANRALAACEAPYVLLLNSDTRLKPGTLQALSAYLDRHPRAAVVGPRLLNPNGSLQPSCYAFPTPGQVFLEESTLTRLVQRVPGLRERFVRTGSHEHSRTVAWVLGAALAIRREAFGAIGGFDEAYFLYAEEIDLCYRLQRAGWETHFAPCASVVHVGGASTEQRRAEMAVQFFRSLLRFYQRHYTPRRLRQVLWIMKGIVLLRWLRDSARVRWLRERQQRARVAENLTAWRQILWSPAPRERGPG
jgi:GT2 family glycosyltransferase